ncbi:MAG: SMC family ATPase [Anaerolineae bacterium]|nr:SMC family ATPase [Anaerolineae bacterium]
MRILKIDLDNVKSYRRASITFAPGVNAICGHNGAGKSTLLEAIGFVLFDFLAVKHDDFVREGEKTAAITVHIAGADGRVYQVTRRFGGSNQYYVYDPELNLRLTENKVETVTWLRDFLGVNPAMDLTMLFRDAVGVPQGLLTAPFLETASRRKDVFNPLLRVDEYERVWNTLREPRRRLEQQIATKEKDIAGLEAEVKTLPELREQLSTLADEIARNTQRQSAAQAELDETAERKSGLETLKAQLDAQEKKTNQAEADLQTLTARRSDAHAALKRSEAAQTVVDETAGAHQAYLAAEERLSTLETERSQRDQVQQALQTCSHAQELAQQEAARLEQTLAGITQAEAEAARLEPLAQKQKRLETELNESRRAVERLESAERTLARERQRLTDAETRQTTLQTQLEERAALEVKLQTAQAGLETGNARREALAAQLAAQQADCQLAGEQAKQASRQLKDAQKGLEQARQRRAELEAKRDEVQRDLETLTGVEAQIEAARADITALEQQDREIAAQLAADRAEMERLHTQSAVLAASESADCPVCGAPLSPEHRQDLLAQNEARVSELDAAIAGAQAQQNATAKERRNREKTLRALEKQAKDLPRPAEAEALAEQVTAQQQEVSTQEATLAAAQTEVAERAARLAALQAALDAARPEVDAAEAARAAAQDALHELETQLKALPRAAEGEELKEQIATQRQTVAESEQAVAALSHAPDETSRLEAALAALGDPQRDYRRACDVMAQREAVVAKNTANAARLAQLATQRAEQEAQLAVYGDLDARIAAARSDRTAHAPGHQRHLQHEREAAALAERRDAWSDLDAQAQTAQTHRDAQIAARDDLARQYDAPAYERLATQHGQLREELAGLQAALRHQHAQQTEKQEAIARLEMRQQDLKVAQTERDELAADQSLLENLRQVLRDAGPGVTRAMVEIISMHADRLYADIMQSYVGKNPTARLRWTPDYDIVLTREGRERSFRQLSGGEQMAAALAVQLALLREISAVDVAFFDEPTTNLDRDRRANLAKQVLNIQGFGQLFVISHDDTFEQDTDHVVHIEKMDGESRVAA